MVMYALNTQQILLHKYQTLFYDLDKDQNINDAFFICFFNLTDVLGPSQSQGHGSLRW